MLDTSLAAASLILQTALGVGIGLLCLAAIIVGCFGGFVAVVLFVEWLVPKLSKPPPKRFARRTYTAHQPYGVPVPQGKPPQGGSVLSPLRRRTDGYK